MDQERINALWEHLGQYASLRAEFVQWPQYPLYVQARDALQLDVLYQSSMHGVGHIRRVMLFGALIAMMSGFDPADTQLLLLGCAYHDTGRIDDSLDDAHGARSAARAARITGATGQDLAVLQAMMCAHSISDRKRTQALTHFAVQDTMRANRLTDALKDADALDRVRIDDLDVRYLRSDASRALVDFAYALYPAYCAVEKG